MHLKLFQAAGRLTLKTCASKVGQRFQRQEVHADNSFLLRDVDSGKCLCLFRNAHANGALERSLSLCTCSPDDRWMELKQREQVQHVRSQQCLDSGDGTAPILYPCHMPKA